MGHGGSGVPSLPSHLKVLHTTLKDIEVIMPTRCLHVKDVIRQNSQVGDKLLEGLVNIYNALMDLRPTSPSKDGQGCHGRKLQLCLANLQKVVATLEECINVGKDGSVIKIPWLGSVGADCLGCLLVQSLPLFTYK